MKPRPLILLNAAMLLVASGCQPAPQTPSQDPSAISETAEVASTTNAAQRRALTARDALFQQLVRRLFEAMASGGPSAAIEVCSREAAQISQSVSEEFGVVIGRTSFNLRNPANAAPEWATSLIEQRHEEPSFVELSNGATGALLPIKLKSQCLTCHGPTGQIPDEVKAKLAELYPDDQATGFKEGDLRGWFWVVVSAKGTRAVNDARTFAETFAQFDQAYIPALALTKQEKADPSKAALRRLAQRWNKLRPSLTKPIVADAKWPHDLKVIDETIMTSVKQVQKGQLADAHETLEVIRDLMMNARRRQEISYPLDALSDFHTTMEEIVKPAMNYTPATVTEEEIKRLHTLSAVADKKWKTVEATQFDLSLLGVDPSTTGRLRKHIENERQAIANLEAALEKKDIPTIIKTARGLKPPFAKAYMFFGDFPKPAEGAQ